MERNVPKLRFNGFNDEWKEEKLDKLGVFFKGNGISKADLSQQGKPCILYGELYTKYGEVIDKVYSKTNLNIKNPTLSKVNDVIIPSAGETAIDIATASCVQQNDILLGGDLNVFRPNKANGIFISYQLNNAQRREIAKIAQGASVVHVYKDQLKKVKVKLPSLQEQERIANFLTKVDKIIEKQEEKVKNLENYKKGMMQKIFSQEIRFKDENGNEYPLWEEKRLGEIADVIMGQSPSSEAYNENYEGIPLIQGNADIKLRKTVPRIYTTEITKTCEIGDIIMSVRAPVGSIGIANHHCCIGRGVCTIKANINNDYLYQVLLEKENKWSSISQGSTFESINRNDINGLKLLVPSLKEQQKIANFLTKIDLSIQKEYDKLKELKQWKKGLLQQMFI